jgi:hypothetical protein
MEMHEHVAQSELANVVTKNEQEWTKSHWHLQKTSNHPNKDQNFGYGQSTSGHILASISIQIIPCQSVNITKYSLSEK